MKFDPIRDTALACLTALAIGFGGVLWSAAEDSKEPKTEVKVNQAIANGRDTAQEADIAELKEAVKEMKQDSQRVVDAVEKLIRALKK